MIHIHIWKEINIETCLSVCPPVSLSVFLPVYLSVCLHVLVGPAEHVVDDGQELHDPLVQVQVLQALEEIRVLAAVTADHGYLLGLGLSGEH